MLTKYHWLSFITIKKLNSSDLIIHYFPESFWLYKRQFSYYVLIQTPSVSSLTFKCRGYEHVYNVIRKVIVLKQLQHSVKMTTSMVIPSRRGVKRKFDSIEIEDLFSMPSSYINSELDEKQHCYRQKILYLKTYRSTSRKLKAISDVESSLHKACVLENFRLKLHSEIIKLNISAS